MFTWSLCSQSPNRYGFLCSTDLTRGGFPAQSVLALTLHCKSRTRGGAELPRPPSSRPASAAPLRPSGCLHSSHLLAPPHLSLSFLLHLQRSPHLCRPLPPTRLRAGPVLGGIRETRPGHMLSPATTAVTRFIKQTQGPAAEGGRTQVRRQPAPVAARAHGRRGEPRGRDVGRGGNRSALAQNGVSRPSSCLSPWKQGHPPVLSLNPGCVAGAQPPADRPGPCSAGAEGQVQEATPDTSTKK